MASGTRTGKYRSKRTGKTYWIEYRVGFNGREYNAGGGWRRTVTAAHEAAERAGELREVRDA
jgi:hypothetical protein